MRKLIFGLMIAGFVGCSDDRPEESRSPDLERAVAIRERLVSESSGTGEEVPEELPDPTGFVTFSGTFKIDGAPPSAGTLNIDKNLDICLPGGGSLPSESIRVNSANQGIRDILIFAEKVPAAWLHESAHALETEQLFDQKQCLFLDHVLALQTSQQLMIKNSDPIGHNTKFEPRGNPALNVNLGSGETYPYTPKKEVAAPFQVSCTVHSWMKAYMIFRDNAYFAVTDENGKFEIANVPSGVPLQWRIWHERGASMKSVTVDGNETKLSRGSMTYTLDAEKELQITISAKELE